MVQISPDVSSPKVGRISTNSNALSVCFAINDRFSFGFGLRHSATAYNSTYVSLVSAACFKTFFLFFINPVCDFILTGMISLLVSIQVLTIQC